jgi:hypothetical protein
MKKIALAGAVLALVAGNALAAGGTPNTGTFGLNVGIGSTDPATDFVLSGKYFLARDMAVLAGVGIQFADNGAATNNTSTNIGFLGGIRKYLKTDDLAPFIGGQLGYISTKQANTGADQSNFSIGAEAGAEYFLSRSFSFEGSVFAGYTSQSLKLGGVTNKSTTFGTSRANLSVNFYF